MPEQDVTATLEYYAEMIDDRIEAGMAEAEAVAALDAPDVIAWEMMGHPLPKQAMVKQRKPWQTAALILGSPLWVSLLIVAIAIILAAFAVIWAVIAAAWAAVFGLGMMALAMLVGTVPAFLSVGHAQGLFQFGMALSCAGLGVFAAIGAWKLSKACAKCSKQLWSYIKSHLEGRGELI